MSFITKLKKSVLLESKYFVATLAFTILLMVIVLWLRNLGFVDTLSGYFVGLVSFFSFHAYLTHRKEKKKHSEAGTKHKAWYAFIAHYLWERVILLFATFGLIAFFFIYNNDLNPAMAPGYYLVNAKTGQEVYFQGMSHIGSADFYSDVKKRVKSYTNSGFVLYYEKVTAENDEEMERLAGKMGVKPSPSLYANIGSALGKGMTSQNNDDIVSNAKTSKHADVSVAEILGETGSVTNVSTGTVREPSLKEKEIARATEEVNALLEKLVKSRNKTLPYAMQGVFNFVMKNSWLQDFAMWMQKPEDQEKSFFEERIVNYRNAELAKDVLTGGDKKVFITYGMLHYEGFLKELNEQSAKEGNGTFEIVKREGTRIF